MRNIFTIAMNDIYIFLKDVTGYIWLFAMPLLFTLFFGFVMRPGSGEPANPRPSVLIDNQDKGYCGALLMREMDAQGMNLVDQDSETKPNRGIRIPADFTQRIENKERVDVTFFKIEDSSPEAAAMVELRLTRALIGLTSGLFSLATDNYVPLTEESLRERLTREDAVLLNSSFAGRRQIPSGFQQSVPAYMVMFILMNLLVYGGVTLASERTSGVLRRIAVHPITRGQLMVGKILGLFLLGVVQIVFFLTSGRLLFGVDYAGNLGLILVTLLILAWFSAGLGLLIGAVLKRPEQVQGTCLLVSLLMAALGGCWWPMEIVPDFMRRVGHLFPTAWSMDALHQLISFGGGFAQIQFELAILTLYAIASTALSAYFLRW